MGRVYVGEVVSLIHSEVQLKVIDQRWAVLVLENLDVCDQHSVMVVLLKNIQLT